MIAATRSRDPRLMRARQQHQHQQPPPHSSHMPHPIAPMAGMSITKSMPRIPKFSQSHGHANNNKTSRNDDHDRDPRNRRIANKEKEEKVNKNNLNSKDRHKDKSKLSSRSSDNKKSGSSDDSSPRKKGDDDKKSPKNSSSRHRSRSRISPSKPSTYTETKDVDLRLPSDLLMKPDSTTNKDKLLSELLNGEDMKSSHDMITSDDNGKEKTILAVTINFHKFIVAIM